MKVTKSPDDLAARTNCIFINPSEAPKGTRHLLLQDQFAFTIKADASVPVSTIGTTLFHRRFAGLSLGQDVRVAPLTGLLYCSGITLVTSFLKKSASVEESYDTDAMAKLFCSLFDGHVFSLEQSLYFEFKAVDILVQVVGLDLVDPDMKPQSGPKRGILMTNTAITFTKQNDSSIRLKGSTSVGNAIIKPDFNFADLGIGGLDDEFSSIFRRAFVSRIFPPAIVERMGIQHVKGILLYGPPGTGKTLMARQIGKMLNCNEPLIVNGPEILNKFVGQSEENVRKLFAPAEAEYKAKREESSLHIIIFDELDAICKQRGSKNDGTGVGDSVVNQLLSKMDGVDQLNNILIIGMTNRLDMIDEALLRPGRLEIHMEINLPDENGRVQILNVHTSKMRQFELLEKDVDLKELASMTKNFSGAEIAGLIKSASSFAFNRHIKVGDQAAVTPDFDKIKVARADFMHALDEVRPAFGVSEAELQQCVPNGIIKYDSLTEQMIFNGGLLVAQVKTSKRTPLVSVLLHGPPGSGKTALAATIAISSEFPFIKLISPESMVGFSEVAKMNHISKVFADAYKSPFSVVVIDAIERLLDWVAIGPRFSNSVLQTLLVLMKKAPPKNHKLLILATSSQRSILDQMELVDAFNSSIYVPNITTLAAVDKVLASLGQFDEKERAQIAKSLKAAGVELDVAVGVKKLIYMAEMALQDEDKVEKFVITMQEEGVIARTRS